MALSFSSDTPTAVARLGEELPVLSSRTRSHTRIATATATSASAAMSFLPPPRAVAAGVNGCRGSGVDLQRGGDRVRQSDVGARHGLELPAAVRRGGLVAAAT